jgi:hypothetical protein
MKKPKVTKAPSNRGRPPYQPKIEDRTAVEEMKFCGESENVIARALGIDVNTLRKHFPDELANGHANRRREIIGVLFKAARADNVTAAKRLEEMGRVAGAAEALERRAAPKEAKLGKKQEQQAAAERIGGKYAPPAPPMLVVNNR